MQPKHLVCLLCVWTVAGRPSRPLNDRPSELAWQAWLLVDAQNNPGDPDRRITPKSVFIAPKLGQTNGSLPDCADGYRSDPMGRCIKFVKVDEAAHLDFLLERLNAMYATNVAAEPGADDDADDGRPTSGPLQVNIPLDAGAGPAFQASEEPAPDPEIAIIVAPTNGNFDVDDAAPKVNVKRTHVGGDRVDAMAADQQQTTPSADETTTPEAGTEETTAPESTTTGDGLQALFFLVPMNESDHVPGNRTATEDADPPTTNSTALDVDTEPEALPAKGAPDPQSALVADGPVASFVDASPVDDYQAAGYVRFPGVQASAAQLPVHAAGPDSPFEAPQPDGKAPEPHRLTSGEIQELFRQYIQQNPEVVALTSSEKHPVRRRPVSEATYTDGEDVAPPQPVQRPQFYVPASFNHRNRDRNSEFWRPATSWSEDEHQKPLVLRFGRYPPLSSPASSSRFSSEQLVDDGHHRYYEDQSQAQHQDFSSSFGRTRRRGVLR